MRPLATERPDTLSHMRPCCNEDSTCGSFRAFPIVPLKSKHAVSYVAPRESSTYGGEELTCRMWGHDLPVIQWESVILPGTISLFIGYDGHACLFLRSINYFTRHCVCFLCMSEDSSVRVVAAMHA